MPQLDMHPVGHGWPSRSAPAGFLFGNEAKKMKKKKETATGLKTEVFAKFSVMADLDMSVTEACVKALKAGMPAAVVLLNVIGSIKCLMRDSGLNDEEIRNAFMQAINAHERITHEVKKHIANE
jgi:hypothetical protein